MLDISPASAEIAQLHEKFAAASEKNQLQMIPEIEGSGSAGIEFFINWLQHTWNREPTIVAGAIYQALYHSEIPTGREYLHQHLPTGIVKFDSDRDVDYSKLQHLLAERQFEAADKLTSEKLCELAGPAASSRKWLYFTDAEQLPATDLRTIDRLWLVHSNGRFGFSIQRQLWLSVGKNWDKLWPKIGWKSGKDWTRYPGSFTWNLTAPIGHLPLSNQLRGVRTMDSLLSHPAWEQV
jgi:hypothetical protein